MSAQSCRWCFTLNNWSNAEAQVLVELAPTVKYLVFGREVGENGTPHLQGFVIFFTNKRLNSAKLAISNRAHLEIARGTSDQAAAYCKKENDFEEFGSVPVQGRTNRYDDFREWVLSQATKPSSALIANLFPSLWLQNSRLMEFVDLIFPTVIILEGEFRAQQQALADRLVDSEPNDREILFVVDVVGNTGKTWFAKKFFSLYPDRVQQLSVGKRDDIAFAVDEHKSIFLFDLPRSASEFLQYTVLEQLKNGSIMSNKYQSRNKVLVKTPHVVVFMNEYPDMTKLSGDRYVIINWN